MQNAFLKGADMKKVDKRIFFSEHLLAFIKETAIFYRIKYEKLQNKETYDESMEKSARFRRINPDNRGYYRLCHTASARRDLHEGRTPRRGRQQ